MFTTANHQAQGLAKLAGQRDTKVIAITGGKGGVGKTSVAVNLSMVMAMNGHDIALLDADLGLANVDVHLGLCPQRHLGHLLDGECDLAGLMLEAAHGLKVIPASSGRRRMAQLGSAEHAALIHAVAEYPGPLDTLIVDTAAGLSDSVTMFCSAADEVVVVLTDEPASLTDSYALIKVLSRECQVDRFRVLTNLTTSPHQGKELYLKLRRVTDHFLDVVLDYMGNVPADPYLKRAVRRQSAVVDMYPGSRASAAFKLLAGVADKWVVNKETEGRLALRPARSVVTSRRVSDGAGG